VDSVIYHTKLRGRPPKGEGLRPTKLEPSKTRAFGLREGFKIVPSWTQGKLGIALGREALRDEVAEAVEEGEKAESKRPAKRRQRWRGVPSNNSPEHDPEN
jgi:hypothetical protein